MVLTQIQLNGPDPTKSQLMVLTQLNPNGTDPTKVLTQLNPENGDGNLMKVFFIFSSS